MCVSYTQSISQTTDLNYNVLYNSLSLPNVSLMLSFSLLNSVMYKC